MRIVVGVDCREQSRVAVEKLSGLFARAELVLVHAVDLGALETYPLVPLLDEHAYKDFEVEKARILEESRRQLEQLAVPAAGVRSVHRVCEQGKAADVILNATESFNADLVVVGHRGLGRFAEQAMGSISHLVLLQARCSTMVVKGPAARDRRVLVAVKGPDDAERVQAWLIAHPFENPVEMVVINVVPPPVFGGMGLGQVFEAWMQRASTSAQRMVEGVAEALVRHGYPAKGRIASGDARDLIAAESEHADLLVVSTHGRRGVHRFLFGSVSHSLVHRTTCSVLVIR